MARSFPGPPQQRSDGVARRERSYYKEPAADAEQRAAGQRLPAGAAAGEHRTEPHHTSTGEREYQPSLPRDFRSAPPPSTQSAGKRRRRKPADRHADQL